MALDKRTPLIERLRFLAISGRNLDEFFCKRVGALKRQEAVGVQNLISRSPSVQWTPTQTLRVVAREVERMVQTQVACLQRDILPAMRREGIHVVQWDDLDKATQKEVLYCAKQPFFALHSVLLDKGTQKEIGAYSETTKNLPGLFLDESIWKVVFGLSNQF